MGETKSAVAEQLVAACRLMHERGLIAGIDGNVSARTDRGTFLVTPSGVHKGLLRADDVVEVDARGAPVSGGAPTSELPMHLEIFHRRADVFAIVHSHAPMAVATTLVPRLSLNRVLPELVSALGDVATVPYTRPGTTTLARKVAEVLGHSRAVLIERHGTVAVGSTVTEALARTEMIEHAAKIIMAAHALRRPAQLDELEVRALSSPGGKPC